VLVSSNSQSGWGDFVKKSYDQISKLSTNQKVAVSVVAGAVALGAWFYSKSFNNSNIPLVTSGQITTPEIASQIVPVVLEESLNQVASAGVIITPGAGIGVKSDRFNYQKLLAVISVGAVVAATGWWLYHRFCSVNSAAIPAGSGPNVVLPVSNANSLSAEASVEVATYPVADGNGGSVTQIEAIVEQIQGSVNHDSEGSIVADSDGDESDLDLIDTPPVAGGAGAGVGQEVVVDESKYDDFTSYNESIYSGSDYRNAFDEEEHDSKLKFAKVTEKNKKQFNFARSICGQNGKICFLDNGIRGQVGSVLVKKSVKTKIKDDERDFFSLYNFDGMNDKLLLSGQRIKVYRFGEYMIALSVIGKTLTIKKLLIRSSARIEQVGRDFIIYLRDKSRFYDVQLDAIAFMDDEGQVAERINYQFD